MLVLLRGILVNPGPVVRWITSKRNLHETQELVHARNKRLRLGAVGVNTGVSIEADDLVGHVGSHNEIVLYDEGGRLGDQDPALHYACRNNTLFGVEVSRGLVDKEDVAGLCKSENDSHALQLSS